MYSHIQSATLILVSGDVYWRSFWLSARKLRAGFQSVLCGFRRDDFGAVLSDVAERKFAWPPDGTLT